MLPNGLLLTLDLAVSQEVTLTSACYGAVVLGLFAEDTVVLPGTAIENPSLGHLWPRSKRHCQKLYDRAVGQSLGGKQQRALYTLGRAIHVLADMACPVHAQAVWHYLEDPYELYVDAHCPDLATIDIPPLPQDWTPESLVTSLAMAAQQHIADRTQSPWGKLMKKSRRRKPLTRRDVMPQAQQLIPLAAAHIRALVLGFQQQTSGATP